jgi:hypothetical protein
MLTGVGGEIKQGEYNNEKNNIQSQNERKYRLL